MVKTTKKLLNFLQSLNKCVQKKTEKEYLFIRRYILFWGKMKTAKPQRGRKATAPLHTPRAFFKGVLGCGDGRLLTCGCILRYWRCGRLSRCGFLDSAVLDFGRLSRFR